MDKIKNKWPLALIAVSLLGYTHYMVADKIAIGLIVLFYIVEIAAIVVIIIGLLWLFRWWLTDWQISKTKVDEAKAKAKNAEVMVFTAKRDEQLAVRDPDQNSYYRQLHLSPTSHVNGQYQAPTSEQMAIYNTFHQPPPVRERGNNLVIDAAPTESRDDILSKYGNGWIAETVLNAFHLHICGPTGSGKTTLANCYLNHRLKLNPQAKVYLVNPKDIPGKQPFIAKPVCKSIDDVMDWLSHFQTLLTRRQQGLDEMTTPFIFIIDEWDWIYDTYGNSAVHLARSLIKVGRELNISVLLIGQSPLSGDTGLNGSVFDNMCRVGILASGEKLLSSLVLDKGQTTPFRAEFAALRGLNSGIKADSPGLIRYCLVTAMGGNPTIQIIPRLAMPKTEVLAPSCEALPISVSVSNQVANHRPNSEEMRIFVAWRDLGKGNRSFNKLWKAESGNTSNVSRKKADEYRELFNKYGVKY